MTNTVVLSSEGRGLVSFVATNENIERLARRLKGYGIKKDPPMPNSNKFVRIATRLMNAIEDPGAADLDITVIVAIMQISKLAAQSDQFNLCEQINVNMIRGDDGRFGRFEIGAGIEGAVYGFLCLEFAGRLVKFEATPAAIKDLRDDMAANP